MNPNRLRAAWEQYVGTQPEGSPITGNVQHAFYSGAAALVLILNTVTDPGDEPTEADLKIMDDMADEIMARIGVDVRPGGLQ